MMKKIFIAIILALPVLITGCSKDENGNGQVAYVFDFNAVQEKSDITISQFPTLKGDFMHEIVSVITNMDNMYANKQKEVVKQIDAIVEKYDYKTLYGNPTLQSTGTVNGSHTIGEWELHLGPDVIKAFEAIGK